MIRLPLLRVCLILITLVYCVRGIYGFFVPLFSSDPYVQNLGMGLWVLRIEHSARNSIAWWVVILSAFIGSYSHALIDSIMYSDVQPVFPFVLSNAFWGIISVELLHKFCLYSGLLGAAIYYFVQWRNQDS